jgi:hypothetical protein
LEAPEIPEIGSRVRKVRRVKGISLVLLSMFYMAIIILAYEFLRNAFEQRAYYFDSFKAIVAFVSLSGLIVTYLVQRMQLRRETIEEENERLIHALHASLEEVKTLSGLLPICAHCKKIRNDKGYWQQIELYIGQHSEATFSHGICEDCLKEHYPLEGLAKQKHNEVNYIPQTNQLNPHSQLKANNLVNLD